MLQQCRWAGEFSSLAFWAVCSLLLLNLNWKLSTFSTLSISNSKFVGCDDGGAVDQPHGDGAFDPGVSRGVVGYGREDKGNGGGDSEG